MSEKFNFVYHFQKAFRTFLPNRLHEINFLTKYT